jgi:hypothetical protein
MYDSRDTQIESEVDYSYSQKCYARYSNMLKEGQLDLDGAKNRISDDNSLKNKIQLTTKKIEHDDELRILQEP